jgi:3-oxoadipate enol-lactonase
MTDTEGGSSLLSVQVHGDHTHHETGGTVVLGPALGTTPAIWTPMLAYLPDVRVVMYALRGHAGSVAPPGGYQLADLAQDVLTVMDQLHIASAHHVGMSLGGMIALHLAVTHPDRVDSLGLICTSAHPDDPQQWRAWAAQVREQGMAAVAEQTPARWFTEEFVEDPAARDAAAALLTVEPQGYAGCCEALADIDLRRGLTAVAAPTLVIAGDGDEVFPVEHSRLIADEVPDARMHVIDRAAHLAAVQHPRRVADLVRELVSLPPFDAL